MGGPDPAKLAIIAGRGDLPRRIAEHRRDNALPYLVIAFGTPDRWMHDHPHEAHRFEKVGRLFRSLHRAGCREVVFAGAMDRPRLEPWRADWKGAMLAARVLALLRRGDDALLSGLGRVFEAEGFALTSAEACLGGLTAGPGPLGRHRPGREARADLARAAAILRALGPLDLAQAVVVARGICLGIEAIEGTDALLARVAALPEEKRRHAPPPAGLLLKMPKPGQDRRVDLPTIGPATVAGAARAGLAGIAIEAHGTQVLDRAETVAAADRAGLFLWSVPAEELSP